MLFRSNIAVYHKITPYFSKIIRPILRGRDIKRTGYEWAGLYVIATHNGYNEVPRVNIDEYPALKDWFDYGDWNDKPEKGNNIERLSKRTDKGDTPYNLRDCAYMDDFSKQKILYSEIVRSPQFYLYNNNFIPEATAFLMSGECLEVLVNYLNSPIVAWIFKRFYAGGGLGEEGYRYKKAFMINLPIPTTAIENYTDDLIMQVYAFTDEEISFISSVVKS